MGRLSDLWTRAKFRLSYRGAALRSRIILSAGMPRSGSTWLFNAARLLLQSHDTPSSGWIGDWATLPRRPLMLVKIHEHDPFLARHAHGILYSYRDIRDALASGKRKFGIEPTLELARHWLASDRRWRAQATFTLRYESMLTDPESTVRALARSLRLAPDDAKFILPQLHQVDYQPDRARPGSYDRETLLHPGHITDGRHGSWRGWLSPALVRQIEDECHDWLVENGYQAPGRGAPNPEESFVRGGSPS